ARRATERVRKEEMTMNRNVSALLFFAAATFVAGCSGGSTSAGMGTTGSPSSVGSGAGPAGPIDTDLEAFARTGMADPEYVAWREVNDLNFISNETPDAFADWF